MSRRRRWVGIGGGSTIYTLDTINWLHSDGFPQLPSDDDLKHVNKEA